MMEQDKKVDYKRSLNEVISIFKSIEMAYEEYREHDNFLKYFEEVGELEKFIAESIISTYKSFELDKIIDYRERSKKTNS